MDPFWVHLPVLVQLLNFQLQKSYFFMESALGTTPLGIGHSYLLPFNLLFNSSLACSSNSGFSIRSTATPAIASPTISVALCAGVLLPTATACQECAAVPTGHVGALRETVGTIQLTSPTSEDAGNTISTGLKSGIVSAIGCPGFPFLFVAEILL